MQITEIYMGVVSLFKTYPTTFNFLLLQLTNFLSELYLKLAIGRTEMSLFYG